LASKADDFFWRKAAVGARSRVTDHLRLTDAARGGATVVVTPVLPADVIGLYVLLPEGE
jgi:hypothetical protein